MTEFGYGQLAYLSYSPAQQRVAARIHHELALRGVIVLDTEPAGEQDDSARAKLAALERAKVRCADLVAVVHLPDGTLDSHRDEVVGYAETLGKRVTHYGPPARIDVAVFPARIGE